MAHRNFARAMRRKTQWGGFGDETGAVALGSMQALAAATPVILGFNIVVAGGVGLVDEEVTITRMIGNVTCMLNNITASAQARVALGCIVVRNETITAGVASLPSPEDDPDAEWLYYSQFDVTNPVLNSIEGVSGVNVYRMAFDVHSQRVVRSGSTVVWIGESQTNNVLLGVAGRYLVKLT